MIEIKNYGFHGQLAHIPFHNLNEQKLQGQINSH